MLRITTIAIATLAMATTITWAANDDQSPSNLMDATIRNLKPSDQKSIEPESALMGIGIEPPAWKKGEKNSLLARAGRGDLAAMYELAQHSLRKGGPMNFWGTWGDVKETEKWWRKAAGLGDAKAMILLGHMYAEPWGVPQNIGEAANWFQKAAEKGQMEAVQALIDLYLGAWSDERDGEAALPWLKRAAAAGDSHAMLILGLMYDAGWEIREDAGEAVVWYNKVIDGDKRPRATGDQSYALNNLGAMYEEGRGVPKDESRAAALYRRASGFPSLKATYNLAVLCEQGRGVPQDKAAALWLYRDAAMFDLAEAKDALKRLGFVPDQNTNKEAKLIMDHADEKRVKTACDR